MSLLEYAAPFDTLSICFSKSLGCPIGSVVVGSAKIIQRAKHFRKLFGGGWRQAGVLASAALYALDHHWDRLAEDHEVACYLRDQLVALGFEEDILTQTNQVWLSSKQLGVTFTELSSSCRKAGILIPQGNTLCRLVTHLQTSKESCDVLLNVVQDHLLSRR
jgi:threonine aldolase